MYTVYQENNLGFSSRAKISKLMAQQFHYKLQTLGKLLCMFSKVST
jgi:hypothetical protein